MSSKEFDYLGRYDAMSHKAAAEIIGSYSTSFGLATQLLAPAVRRDIRNLYAMVRIADEIVDGTARDAGTADVAAALDRYEEQVRSAPATRFHTDPVLHAYAISARRCAFDDAHVEAFFRSMRADLHRSTYDAAGLDAYIYGSAEVIGLLCLSAFYADTRGSLSDAEYAELEAGARALGAAFQKVNFLRDYAEDSTQLGRAYFPAAQETLTAAAKDAIVADIRNDLAQAWEVIPRLPLSARIGVIAAADFFAELNERIDKTPVSQLKHDRVRVPAAVKARILARAALHAPTMKVNNND